MRNVLRAALCGVALGGLVAAAAQAQETSIVVSDARFEGSTVFIPSATVSQPAFAVVHADDPAQTVLGYAVLDPGINEEIAVTLARAPQPGEEFIVMLHQDTGTVGTFEFAEGVELDRPLVVAGAPVAARLAFAEGEAAAFVVEPDAAVELEAEAAVAADADAAGIDVSNATHSGNVLHFSSVTMPSAGFLVIHAAEEGEPIIGQTPLQAGVNQDVTVTLDRNPAVGEELIAMLHLDVGVAGQFEPETDEPLMAGGGTTLIGPFGEELIIAADDPVSVRFRVASDEEGIAAEQPAERLAAPIPEEAPAERSAADSAAPETQAAPSSEPPGAPQSGSGGGSAGGY